MQRPAAALPHAPPRTQAACRDVVVPIVDGYIWQRDAFDLAALPGTAAGALPRRRRRARPERTASAPPRQVSASARRRHRCGGAEPAHLGGSAAFGDALEDEWFIAWLVAELTRRIPYLTARRARPQCPRSAHQTCAERGGAFAPRRVWDNDGEFLLIEAAYSLPRWRAAAAAAAAAAVRRRR